MSWLATNTCTAAALAAIVFIACRTLKPRPALAHLLWLLVLVELVCPPVLRWEIPLPLPLGGRTAIERAPVVEDTLPDLATVVALADTAPPVPTPPAATNGEPIDWSLVLLGVWLAGSALVLFSMFRGIARLRRLARGAMPATTKLEAELETISARMQVRKPELRVVDGIGSAFVWSLARPVLFWPAQMLDVDDPRQVSTVLAHELAHIRRRDHWVAWLEVCAFVLLWWHPLLWLARARLREQAELACDAWAVWAVPTARRAYAGALIDALGHESKAVAVVPVLGARPAARRAFEKRLLMILNEDVPRRLSRWALVPLVALGVTAVSGFSPAQERSRRDRAEQTKNDVLEIVNKELQAKLGSKYRVERLEDVGEVVRKFALDQQRKATKPAKPEPKDDSVVSQLLRQGLEEARREIRKDKDLERLGLTKDVEQLVERLLTGKGEVRLDKLLEKAIGAGLDEARREIKNDKDLRELGIAGAIDELLKNLQHGKADLAKGLDGILRQALKGGLAEARREIRNDEGLRQLGIADDVDRLLEGLIEGKARLGNDLEQLIQKAMRQSAKIGAKEFRKNGQLGQLLDDEELQRTLEGVRKFVEQIQREGNAGEKKPAKKPTKKKKRWL